MLRKEMKMIRYFIDMDGVLAKWNEFASEEDTHERGYFLNRDIELSVAAMVLELKKSGAYVRILSAIYQDDHSAKEKREWLDAIGLRHIEAIFVPYGEDKYRYIDAASDDTCVLLDDFNKNLSSWEDKGHIAIKFMNGINNRPKLIMDKSGNIQARLDSWTGYSIDHRMSVKQMYNIVTSIAHAEAA